ncbi:hypothetical protein EX30DRAFT_398128 [Ascodesmis nigricans]|uniref:Uncharacterized protein n=1 Tax=Ascodesmis nigricans TaxID=341454 RepID=A0A4S2MLX6_9PEZI|nr:hypothetical protein EX30DRAFT_398128 [Ascodesmis nigricans]
MLTPALALPHRHLYHLLRTLLLLPHIPIATAKRGGGRGGASSGGSGGGKLSPGVIAGIVIGTLVVVAILLCFERWWKEEREQRRVRKELKRLDEMIAERMRGAERGGG